MIRRNHASNSSSVGRRRGIEKITMNLLLLMAWTWIGGLVVVIVWQLRKVEETTTQQLTIHQRLHHFMPTVHAWTQGAKTSKATNDHHHDHPSKGKIPMEPYDSPLLIFTCSRASYLSETLQDIEKYISRPCQFGCPIIVSQDGTNKDVEQVVREYQQKFQTMGIPLVHLQHMQAAGFDRRQPGYAYQALAIHYGWALNHVFRSQDKQDDNNAVQLRDFPIPTRVVILEEDIHIAPDFFDYFQATAPLLDNDETLFAVSAFNDNGKQVSDPKRLLRSDFFPGLGWMMTRKLWMNELQAKWPSAYWDDWLREPVQRQERQVIRPEISRTFHFGSKGGASNNQFGSLLDSIRLNDQRVDWKSENLEYLESDLFRQHYGDLLQQSELVFSLDEALVVVKTQSVRLEYAGLKQFQQFAKKLDIMSDEKAMVPRTAYKGVVETRPYGLFQLFLTPRTETLLKDFPQLKVAKRV